MENKKMFVLYLILSLILTISSLVIAELSYWKDYDKGLVHNTGFDRISQTFTYGGAYRYANSSYYNDLFEKKSSPYIEEFMADNQLGMTRPLIAFYDTIFFSQKEEKNHFWLFLNLLYSSLALLAIPFSAYYLFINRKKIF